MLSIEVFELYNLISRGSEHLSSRKQTRLLRKVALDNIVLGEGFQKVAFDTRRIDQETEFNPRRGLQNYNRSEAFISEGLAQKIKSFAKLRDVLNDLKTIYGKEHEWQDSNARVLLSTLDNGLRTEAKDGDFAVNQPGTGSFDYIEELLHVRYRLGFEDLAKMGASDLKKIILSKDEELIRKDVNQALEITKQDVTKQGYDTLMEKLFTISATQDNPNVERSVTITIRDTIIKDKDPRS
jgi:hypothetical protein